jgi:pimeloyl-ACP methyl ester carboxylesterase
MGIRHCLTSGAFALTLPVQVFRQREPKSLTLNVAAAIFEPTKENVVVSNLTVELQARDSGDGPAVVVLPGAFGIESRRKELDDLYRGCRTITVTHPGFGSEKRPDWCDSVQDLAYIYMDFIERLGLEHVTLVGFSFGGWIAAEIALRRPAWLDRLVLVDTLGFRTGGRDDRTTPDLFAMTVQDWRDIAFSDAAIAEDFFGTAGRPDEDILAIARTQEGLAVYGWQPYLHDPKLQRRIGRIAVPTLVIWGAEDRIASADLGRNVAESIPDARFAIIPGAGHFPHLDKPEEFRRHLEEHLGSAQPARVKEEINS